MRIYNTFSRRVEEIVPIEPGAIRMYTCGPTVYRYIHVGNLRTFTMADWLRRALEWRGLRVQHIKNITDVGHMRQEALDRGEDKLIAQARREGKTSAEIAAFYTAAFHEDEQQLNILPAHCFPRATEHVSEMIAIVRDLLARGVAYEVEGNVFFDVTRFPSYGALSGNQVAQHLARAQDEVSAMKRHPEDFPLWKVAEPGREMAWESPWGRGFPGWHIECSAMAIKYLGPQIDLHTGGVDNIFPHHEDEIAQSEAHTGRRFVTYWVHAQHLLSDGLKMAKSTGNAYTLADVTARGFEPLALRYFFTTAHYRSRINFTFSALRAAEVGLTRLRLALRELSCATPHRASALHEPLPTPTSTLPQVDGSARRSGGDEASPAAERAPDEVLARGAHQTILAADSAQARVHQAFLAAVEDDLNIPRAMAVVWSLLRGERAALPAAERLELILAFDRILGLDLAGWLERHASGSPDGIEARALPRAVVDDLAARA
jgi:cysteinyl-tRNA synthetase